MDDGIPDFAAFDASAVAPSAHNADETCDPPISRCSSFQSPGLIPLLDGSLQPQTLNPNTVV